MRYKSTRGGQTDVSGAEAIVQGLAVDGGLLSPDKLPVFTAADWTNLQSLSYQEQAQIVISKFLPEFTAAEVAACVTGAYNEQTFTDPAIAPLKKLQDNIWIEELWHGPTCAFKDMALQILPRLLRLSLKKIKEDKEIIILVATSGDTGKAALEGFKNIEGTRIIVFFPLDGVSEVQKRQMLTQAGSNVYVAAVQGNFDQAQSGVKAIFADPELKKYLSEQDKVFSSANSINWGRLLPQIVYYIYACGQLQKNHKLAAHERINFTVPTGNFGNILAGYYAKKLGAPIGRLICASNSNSVLTDFIRTGVYNCNRKFEKTISPSMDILISSNLERLLYELCGHDGDYVSGLMRTLAHDGVYEIASDIKSELQQHFWAACADDEITKQTIAATWQKHGYLLDTHTAVGTYVGACYRQATGDNNPMVIVSTASPFKFTASVSEALWGKADHDADEFTLLEQLSAFSGWEVPLGLQDLRNKPVLHHKVTAVQDMKAAVLDLLHL